MRTAYFSGPIFFWTYIFLEVGARPGASLGWAWAGFGPGVGARPRCAITFGGFKWPRARARAPHLQQLWGPGPGQGAKARARPRAQACKRGVGPCVIIFFLVGWLREFRPWYASVGCCFCCFACRKKKIIDFQWFPSIFNAFHLFFNDFPSNLCKNFQWFSMVFNRFSIDFSMSYHRFLNNFHRFLIDFQRFSIELQQIFHGFC